MFSYQWADATVLCPWFAGWQCWWAWPLAGCGLLLLTDSLSRRADLLGRPGAGCLAAGLGWG